MNSEEDKKSEKRNDKSKSSSDNDIITNQEREEEEEGNLCQRLNDFCELIRQKTENNKKKILVLFAKFQMKIKEII